MGSICWDRWNQHSCLLGFVSAVLNLLDQMPLPYYLLSMPEDCCHPLVYIYCCCLARITEGYLQPYHLSLQGSSSCGCFYGSLCYDFLLGDIHLDEHSTGYGSPVLAAIPAGRKYCPKRSMSYASPWAMLQTFPSLLLLQHRRIS